MLHFLQSILVGQVDDHHRAVRRLSDAQQAGHRLCLQIGRPGQGMGGGGHLAETLPLGDHAVNDTGVLAVNAADAAQRFQFLQSPVHIPIPDHHSGVGHIHLERGHALGEHVLQLRPDALVPVVNGHVEAVVAEGAAIGLPVPQLQTVVQGLPLIGAGEVDDGGGAALESRTAAGVEVVCGGGARHVQIEVGMTIDKTGEQKTALHIHDPVRLRLQLAAHGDHLFVFHQKIGPLGAAAGHHAAALE